MLLIIIKSSELLPWISQTIINNALKLVKKICFFFQHPLLSVWISDETLFLVIDILHEQL